MSDKPPVRRLSRRTALENRVWRVDLDHVVDANGAEVRDYLVLAARGHAAGTVGGVAVLPVLEDGRIVLLRNWRPAVDAWSEGKELIFGFTLVAIIAVSFVVAVRLTRRPVLV